MENSTNLSTDELEKMAYIPGPSEQLRHSLASDIIIQSLVPHPRMKPDSTPGRFAEHVGQGFAKWLAAEIEASNEAKKDGKAAVVLQSGAMMDAMIGFSAATVAYCLTVLVHPEHREKVKEAMLKTQTGAIDRAVEHVDKVFLAVLSGLTQHANEDAPQ